MGLFLKTRLGSLNSAYCATATAVVVMMFAYGANSDINSIARNKWQRSFDTIVIITRRRIRDTKREKKILPNVAECNIQKCFYFLLVFYLAFL